eukprot:TRINITY_DN9695_c0_g1_i1.p1 TRINITY_DN9695_c0_g1~~TRINITY_DN9695_c0_g1_i1.p1  ORF type:complete len:220 (+),score=43.28 TRINITY_DN9695_c0_g1_i1:49-708(+)
MHAALRPALLPRLQRLVRTAAFSSSPVAEDLSPFAQRLQQLHSRRSRPVAPATASPSLSRAFDLSAAPALLRVPVDSFETQTKAPDCNCQGNIRCIACLHLRLKSVNVSLPDLLKQQIDQATLSNHFAKSTYYVAPPGVAFVVPENVNPFIRPETLAALTSMPQIDPIDSVLPKEEPPATDAPEMQMSSVLKKRKLKMNKHKQRKLRRKLKFLKRKLGH